MDWCDSACWWGRRRLELWLELNSSYFLFLRTIFSLHTSFILHTFWLLACGAFLFIANIFWLSFSSLDQGVYSRWMVASIHIYQVYTNQPMPFSNRIVKDNLALDKTHLLTPTLLLLPLSPLCHPPQSQQHPVIFHSGGVPNPLPWTRHYFRKTNVYMVDTQTRPDHARSNQTKILTYHLHTQCMIIPSQGKEKEW